MTPVAIPIEANTAAAPIATTTPPTSASSVGSGFQASGGQVVGEGRQCAQVELFCTNLPIESQTTERGLRFCTRNLERKREAVGERLAPVRERGSDDLQ